MGIKPQNCTPPPEAAGVPSVACGAGVVAVVVAVARCVRELRTRSGASRRKPAPIVLGFIRSRSPDEQGLSVYIMRPSGPGQRYTCCACTGSASSAALASTAAGKAFAANKAAGAVESSFSMTAHSLKKTAQSGNRRAVCACHTALPSAFLRPPPAPRAMCAKRKPPVCCGRRGGGICTQALKNTLNILVFHQHDKDSCPQDMQAIGHRHWG